jgi:hypothetical protein
LPLEEVDGCNIVPCPIDCTLTSGGAWDECTAKCDGGTQGRKRQILQLAEFGGQACGKLAQTQNCNQRICDIEDQQPCSHVTCDYKAHSLEHAKDVMNFPEMDRSFFGHLRHEDESTMLSRFWHVSVAHDKSERMGGRHYCHNTGQHMPTPGGAPWDEKRAGQSCTCVCWGEKVHQRKGLQPSTGMNKIGDTRRRRYGSTFGAGYDKEARTWKYR